MTADILISRELQVIAAEISERLEEVAGERVEFSLLVFNAREGGRMNYVSNCDRGEVVKAMRSLLEGWGAGMEDIKAHEVM